MVIPRFRKSSTFALDAKLPCLRATIPHASVPVLGDKIDAKGVLKIQVFVRIADAATVSDWQAENLKRLFEKAELLNAIESGLKEFEFGNAYAGYDKDGPFFREIQENGVLPYLLLKSVIIDDVQREIVLSLTCNIDPHLEEHGVVIYFRDGVWKFDYADYVSDYVRKIQADVENNRWRDLFPESASGVLECAVMYGKWVSDPSATKTLLHQLGRSKTEINNALKTFEHFSYDISKHVIVLTTSPFSTMRFDVLGCETCNPRIDLQFRFPAASNIGTWTFFYAHDVLTDTVNVVALRRKS